MAQVNHRVMNLKISWIKTKADKISFEWIKSFGGNVYELENPEEVDQLMTQLQEKENCKTFILSNELAGFSEDMIKKYQEDENINIIIASRKM